MESDYMDLFRNCPICNLGAEEASLFIKENIDPTQISSFSFASRKIPELMCHQLVRCHGCGLVYAPKPPSVSELAQAYHEASYDSSEEATDAANSYIQAITPALNGLMQKDAALEIGAGTGIFLEQLLSDGFKQVVGVEPSKAAIDAAPLGRQLLIKHGIFNEKDFLPDSFDLICCFMTLEHVQDPMEITQSAYRLLRKGGVFITITHNYNSLVNRMLGRRSPIIDIEHMQLFSKGSIKLLFERAYFADIRVSAFKNRYSLQYWLRLSPIPKIFKSPLSGLFSCPPFNKIRLRVNVGNMVTYGYRR
jgi:SAM-dependent methyltransferase